MNLSADEPTSLNRAVEKMFNINLDNGSLASLFPIQADGKHGLPRRIPPCKLELPFFRHALWKKIPKHANSKPAASDLQVTRQVDGIIYCTSDPQVTGAMRLGPVVLNFARAFAKCAGRSKTRVLQTPGGALPNKGEFHFARHCPLGRNLRVVPQPPSKFRAC